MRRRRNPGGSAAADRHWTTEPHGDSYGPQGTALIMELQRLRQAFDEEAPPVARSGKSRRPPPRNARAARPARNSRGKSKGTVERALDICLRPFGLRTSPQGEQRREPGLHEFEVRLPRRSSPPIANDGAELRPPRHPSQPARMAREITLPARLEQPRPRLPVRIEAETPVGRAIVTASSAIGNGVSFLLNSGDAIDERPGDNLCTRTGRGYERELRTGLRILIAAAVIGGGWMTLVPLAGAIVVPGNLVVQSNVKAIQHPSGGIVADIKVVNGRRVAAGDLLLRLDPTQAQASLQTVSKQLDEVRAKIARLIAERDGLEKPDFPAQLTSRMQEDNVRSVIASENSLFKARLNARLNQKELLQGRIAQLTDEITGLEAQSVSKTKQIELISGELTGVQELFDKRLVPLNRLTTLQREAARIEGERGQLVSSVAETRNKIGEAQLQMVKVDQDFRTEVVKDLGEAQAKEGELVEKRIAGRDQLDRIEMRAPTSGVIHQLNVHTIGGVIKAGDTVMEIVPDSDELEVEARVQPKDIDHVRTGQEAFVRFSAFNQRSTPQLSGRVTFVSPDISQDPRAGSSYYTVRIFLSEDERRRLGNVQLVPGMPAEVFMQTGERTMMSYLMKPITDQLRRAFTEQ